MTEAIKEGGTNWARLRQQFQELTPEQRASVIRSLTIAIGLEKPHKKRSE